MAMTEVRLGSVNTMEPKKVKRVSVSSKRQISIPKEFHDALGIRDEIIMEMVNNRLVIKPFKEEFGDFSEEILQELIMEGYSGEDLMKEFKSRKKMIRPAVQNIITETRTQEYTTVDALFSDDVEEDDE